MSYTVREVAAIVGCSTKTVQKVKATIVNEYDSPLLAEEIPSPQVII